MELLHDEFSHYTYRDTQYDTLYEEDYEEDYDEIFRYGISFYKKRCLVSRQ